MASKTRLRRRVPAVSGGYRRLLVPVLGNPESERAVEVACRLAAERRASITAITVIEVPPLLPLDARMTEEEAEARRLHGRATTIADAYGVTVVFRTVRAREAGTAILEELEKSDAELVVIGATRKIRANRRTTAFGRNVQHVLMKASCRVLLVAAAPGPV
ncbi:MAG TPA: universal stress protein [Gaiellaceae bacterium]